MKTLKKNRKSRFVFSFSFSNKQSLFGECATWCVCRDSRNLSEEIIERLLFTKTIDSVIVLDTKSRQIELGLIPYDFTIFLFEFRTCSKSKFITLLLNSSKRTKQNSRKNSQFFSCSRAACSLGFSTQLNLCFELILKH